MFVYVLCELFNVDYYIVDMSAHVCYSVCLNTSDNFFVTYQTLTALSLKVT